VKGSGVITKKLVKGCTIYYSIATTEMKVTLRKPPWLDLRGPRK